MGAQRRAERLHDAGQRTVDDDVEVQRVAAEQQIADRAADDERGRPVAHDRQQARHLRLSLEAIQQLIGGDCAHPLR